MGKWSVLRAEFAGAITLISIWFACVASALEQSPGPIPAAINADNKWRIFKERWDESDERAFSAFVKALGEADCDSLDACLEHPANPYRTTDKRSYRGDCADLVYIFRAYFAWKNGLPFSHQSLMAPVAGDADARYSVDGNRVAARRDATGSAPIDAPSFIGSLYNIVSTAMFRVHPDGGESNGAGVRFQDFYPIQIGQIDGPSGNNRV